MVDLFEEVEEQLRSDRYRELARRIAPWATAIFALVLIGYLGVWGYKAYQDRNLSTAALAYQKGVDALAKNDQAGALGEFREASQAGAPGYKALALMQQGGLRAAAGEVAHDRIGRGLRRLIEQSGRLDGPASRRAQSALLHEGERRVA